MKLSIISLGCAKNTVDSEKLAGILSQNNIQVVFDSLERCDAVVVNTCGFILDSQQESIDTILDVIRLKNDKRRRLKRIYVFGCLAAKSMPVLKEEIPEVDGWFGVNEIEKTAKSILDDLQMSYVERYYGTTRMLSTPKHYAYLKIAEGCNKFCSFCAIPLIRGKHVSRSKEEILAEAQQLYDKGVKEIILLSQDLTYYGRDIYNSLEICDLVRKIAAIGFPWVRLHYAHPNEITDEFLNLYNELPNLCRYLDIPLQHVSTHILSSMKRNTTKEETIDLVKKIRHIVKDMAIRTTFIVGYPGETREDFCELLDFVKDAEFDRVGVFKFSPEENTAAFNQTDDVDDDTKTERLDKIMSLQENIATRNNDKFIGKKVRVLVDYMENDYYVGRTQYDSPEVDNEVLIFSDKTLQIGMFYDVTVEDTMSFDLIAKI